MKKRTELKLKWSDPNHCTVEEFLTEKFRRNIEREIINIFHVPVFILDTEPFSFQWKFKKLPICDVCNKPVDNITCVENIRDYTTVWTANCHGEKEVVRMTDELLVTGDVEFGRAFVKKDESTRSDKLLTE
jgi:hypothetical protein